VPATRRESDHGSSRFCRDRRKLLEESLDGASESRRHRQACCRRFQGRDNFKSWVIEFQKKILDLEFESIETFQNEDGSRVASRWRVTGRNNGIFGTTPDHEPIVMVGTAVFEVREDGLLEHNWVERNAWEVYRRLVNL
jgi:hypothetical protein